MKGNKILPAPLVSPTSEAKSSPSSTVQSDVSRVETFTVTSPLAASSLFTSLFSGSNVSLIFKYLQQAEQHLELTYPTSFKAATCGSASSFAYEDKNALQNWIIQSKAKLKKPSCCSSSYPEEIIDFYNYLNTLTLESITPQALKKELIQRLPSLEEKVAPSSKCCI